MKLTEHQQLVFFLYSLSCKEICYPAQRSDTYCFVFQPAINVLLSVIKKKDAAGDELNYQILWISFENKQYRNCTDLVLVVKWALILYDSCA